MSPELIELIFNSKIESMLAGIPAKIVKYDPKTQKATVQPIIKYRDRSAGWLDAGLKDRPVIQNVPVIHPSAGTAIVSFPVKKGDIVALIFCSDSLDNFLISDGSSTVDPQDNRKYHTDDCYVMLGLYPFSKALGSHPTDLEVRMNSGTAQECKIALKPSGDVVVTTPESKSVTINTGTAIVNAQSEVTVNTEVANINASDSVTIDSPQTTCTGNLRVDQDIYVGNDVSADSGVTLLTHKVIGNLGKPSSVPIPG